MYTDTNFMYIASQSLKRFQAIILVALTFIGGTLAVSSYLVHHYTQKNAKNGKVINLSGRQRMLSQKITKVALSQLTENPLPNEELNQALIQWKESHAFLRSDENGLKSELIGDELERLTPYMNQLEALAVKSFTGLSSSEQSRVYQNEKEFLRLMDKITYGLAEQHRKQSDGLKFIMIGILLLAGLILLFVSVFVFLPQMRKLLNYVQSELERERKQVQLYKLADIGEVSANLAHEVNNFLMGALGAIGILQKKWDALSDEDKLRKLELAAKACNSIRGVVKNVQSFARDERGQLTPISLVNVAQECADLMQRKFEDIGANFEVQDYTQDKLALAGKSQMMQVFFNIMKNALDAQKGLENPFVKVQIMAKEDKIYATFTDNGPGVAPENQEKIMDSFFTTKAPGEGTGLGLPLCRKIANQHGGDLYLDTQAPLTTFILYVKAASSQKKDAA